MTVEKTTVKFKSAGEEVTAPGCPLKRRPGRPKGSRTVDPRGAEWVHRDHSKINDTERKVLSLRLQGWRNREIAEIIGVHRAHVARICRYRRFQEAQEKALAAIDAQAFQRLKPLAVRAIGEGLSSEDVEIALKAAGLWFKVDATGRGAVQPVPSAEDVAQVLWERSEATRRTVAD